MSTVPPGDLKGTLPLPEDLEWKRATSGCKSNLRSF